MILGGILRKSVCNKMAPLQSNFVGSSLQVFEEGISLYVEYCLKENEKQYLEMKGFVKLNKNILYYCRSEINKFGRL